MSVVYFIQAGVGGPVKIGVTRSLPKRLEALQTGCPQELLVIATIKGGQPLEAAFHSRLSAHRLRGEWFNPSDEVMSAAICAASGVGIEAVPDDEHLAARYASMFKPKKAGTAPCHEMVIALGGLTRSSEILGQPVSSVQSWLRAGIPSYRAQAIMDRANGFLAGVASLAEFPVRAPRPESAAA